MHLTHSQNSIPVKTIFFPDLESDDLIPPGNDEIKDNQWLGVTVRSQGVGGKVMVSQRSHENTASQRDERYIYMCYKYRDYFITLFITSVFPGMRASSYR